MLPVYSDSNVDYLACEVLAYFSKGYKPVGLYTFTIFRKDDSVLKQLHLLPLPKDHDVFSGIINELVQFKFDLTFPYYILDRLDF